MHRRKVVMGLCMLCAIAVSAFATSGASAQTAFTCAKGGGSLDFGKEDSHCSKTKVTPGTGEYGHVAFTGSTPITGTNTTTEVEEGGKKVDKFATTKLKSTQSGVLLELQSTLLEGSGTMENKENASKEMYAHGTGFIVYKNVTVTAPAGKGCEVKSIPVTTGEVATVGVVHTKELTASTEGLTNELQFKPAGATPFAEFEVINCSVKALNHVYTVTGSVKGQTTGATTNFESAKTEAEEKLFLFGQKAGIEGTLTIKGANGNGLALT